MSRHDRHTRRPTRAQRRRRALKNIRAGVAPKIKNVNGKDLKLDTPTTPRRTP